MVRSTRNSCPRLTRLVEDEKPTCIRPESGSAGVATIAAVGVVVAKGPGVGDPTVSVVGEGPTGAEVGVAAPGAVGVSAAGAEVGVAVAEEPLHPAASTTQAARVQPTSVLISATQGA